jgi:hypothetical protein
MAIHYPELRIIDGRRQGWPLTSPFAYQWQREGAAIAGATSPAYLVQTADVGHSLTVKSQRPTTPVTPAPRAARSR